MECWHAKHQPHGYTMAPEIAYIALLAVGAKCRPGSRQLASCRWDQKAVVGELARCIGVPESPAGALRNPLESGLITSSELATRPDQHQGAIRKIKRRSPNSGSTIAWALRPISASLWHRPTAAACTAAAQTTTTKSAAARPTANASPSGAPD